LLLLYLSTFLFKINSHYFIRIIKYALFLVLILWCELFFKQTNFISMMDGNRIRSRVCPLMTCHVQSFPRLNRSMSRQMASNENYSLNWFQSPCQHFQPYSPFFFILYSCCNCPLIRGKTSFWNVSFIIKRFSDSC
jgi:hypothetical protein